MSSHTSEVDRISVGPFPLWRWAVAPADRRDIVGIGYWRLSSAMEFYDSVRARFPDRPVLLLLKRSGLRSYEIAQVPR